MPRTLTGCLLPLAVLAALTWQAWRTTSPDDGAFRAAIASGDVAGVGAALDAGADPDFAYYGEDTPLLAAIRSEQAAVVRLLVARGADPDLAGTRPEDGVPLYEAIARGSQPLAVLLLELGADPDAASPRGAHLLFEAVRLRQPFVVAALLEAGAQPDPRDQTGETWAEAVGRSVRTSREVAERMGQPAPRSLDPEELTGITPLMLAARHDDVSTVSALLQAGADPNARDDEGATPLMHAARSPWTSPAVIRALLGAGAETALRDAAGLTALDLARALPQPVATDLLEGG